MIQEENKTLDIHDTAKYMGDVPLKGTNVSTGTLLEYNGEPWYFSSFWCMSGNVTLRKQSKPDEYKMLQKDEAIGLKILN